MTAPSLTGAAEGPEPTLDVQFLERLGQAPFSEVRRLLVEYACQLASDFLGLPAERSMGPHDGFLDLGFNSLRAIDFKVLLERRLGCVLRSTVLFDCPTPDTLVDHLQPALAEQAGQRVLSPREDSSSGSAASEPQGSGSSDPAEMSADELRGALARQSARLAALEELRTEPIAVVGYACRFPGADDPEAFWRLQSDKLDAVTKVPASRWDIDHFQDDDPAAKGKMISRRGGFVGDIASFDARLFGISPIEACSLDPQQRLLLEVSWQALERASIAPDSLAASPTGVFIGSRGSEYYDADGQHQAEDADAYFATGNSLSTMAGRISYLLGFSGPCFALDTACSSGLVAVHQAVQSLRRGECSAALAGGVNLLLDPFGSIAVSKASMLSPDGLCKTFDASADGYVRSEGCGIVVLKRLSRARADGDPIVALIRGTAINQDGASGGLTVPSGAAQTAVIRLALASAGATPGDIDFVEAHGTGTSLGDPIEVAALDTVFGPGRRPDQPLVVGSVKTNIGHGETAAGIASLIKVITALEHGAIPPHLHLHEPSPHIPWDETVIDVPTTLRPWARGVRPRLAGVNSFGFSGTNAHAVVQEAPLQQEQPPSPPRQSELLCLSARDEDALRATASQLAAHLGEHTEQSMADVCHTMNVGRAQLPRRVAFTASNKEELLSTLSAVAAGSDELPSVRIPAQPPRIAFLFTGQGSQYPGMAHGLYQTEPAFRSALDDCAAVLDPLLPVPLTELLWGTHTELLSRTDCTQPALFAMEVALASLWTSWGITPAWVAGHSVGEYAAACCAGVLTLEDGARLVAARGRLMVELTEPGHMIVVSADADAQAVQDVLSAHAGQLSVAAHNGPRQLVLAGSHDAIAAATEALTAAKLRVTALDVSHGFHSPLMEPMLAPFAAVAKEVTFGAPQVGFVSCLTGGPVNRELTDPDYWVRHVSQPVRFADAMSALESQSCDIMIEIGPSPTLLGMARRVIQGGATAWLPSLRPGLDDGAVLMATLGQAWMAGAPVSWPGVQRGHVRRRLLLPTYPFQRERFWLSPQRPQRPDLVAGEQIHPLLGMPLDVATLVDGQRVFATALSASEPEWLAEHTVYESTVTPVAAYAEWALAAARELGLETPCRIERLEVVAALVPDDAGVAVQLVATPDDEGLSFQLFARPLASGDDGSGSSAPWRLHAEGRVVADSDDLPDAVDIEAMAARCTDSQDVPEFYALYNEIGLGYGPRFRPIAEMSRGDGEAWVHLVLPEGSPAADEFVLHPVLLDGCFQSCRTVALLHDLTDMYLPLGMDAVRIHGRHAATSAHEGWWVHIQMGSVSDDGRALVMHIAIYDSTGQPLATVDSLRLIVASRSALMAATDPLKTLAHQVSWEARQRQTIADGNATGHWLVLADEGGFGHDLAQEIELQGGLALVVRRRELAADDPAAWAAVFDELNDPHRPCRGVVHLWGMDGAGADPVDPAAHLAASGSLLALVQNMALAPNRIAPRLYVVSRGAVPASGLPEAVDLPAAALWALAGTVALEHPEWSVTRVDLDPLAGSSEASDLCVEMFADDSETQLAWRGGERRVARLIRRPTALPADGLTPPKNGRPWRLGLSSFGVLDNLTCMPCERRPPGPGEVEIAVSHGALNFKDVMFALGLLQDHTGISDGRQQTFGLECAGQVLALGEGVNAFSVGQRVMASASGSLTSHLTLHASGVAAVPDNIDMATAASVQTVFLTTLYGLVHCAQLKPGQRVLIHAAAGGVGQAAISVAQRAGAEVYATASPGKWPLLRRQGVTHVFSSRDAQFATAVHELTDGQGVHVVLNSLAGEIIEASLDVLCQGGHFVDIGKLDSWPAERMASARPDVHYHAFDMAEVLDADPALLRSLLDGLCDGLADGSLTPPPLRVFPFADGVEALRLLASARTVGKLVLAMPTTAAGPHGAKTPAPLTGTWLITGGTGALGRHVAHGLVDQGVPHVVLGARSAPGDEAAPDIAALRKSGAQIDVVSLDVTDSAAVQTLVTSLAPTLSGVVHAAGALDDGMLVNQTWERFEKVMAPKVRGAWALHGATRALPLEHFIMFSSMVSLVGAQGQGSYATANGFMDALAEHRRAAGLPALSIAWGPWSGDGMASGSAARNKARFADLGIGSVGPEQGTATLARLLGDGAANNRRPAMVGVLPVTWSRFLARFPGDRAPPFFASLARTGAAVRQQCDPLLEQLAQATDADAASELLRQFVGGQLAKVMGFGSASQIDPEQEFVDMGVDSLLAVDLRNRLEAALSQPLPATLLFDHPTLGALVAELLAARAQVDDHAPDEQAMLDEIEQLSDEEVEALLAAEDEHD